MAQRTSSWSFTLLLALLVVAALVSGAMLVWTVSYESLIQHVLAATGKFHLEGALRERFFTPGKFMGLQFLLPLLAVFSGTIVFMYRKWLSGVHIFRHLLADVLRTGRSLRPAGRGEVALFWGIIVFVMSKALFYIIRSDISYDEAWSYNYYTANPWYLTPFIYSNYPLHELLTHCTKWLPMPMYINLRLPVWITGMVWLVATYLCTARLWDRRAGLVGMALMGTLPPAALYMLQAKGFLMVALLVVILVTVLQLVYQEGWSNSRRRWMVLSIFLGLWSSPVFLLPLSITVLSALLLFSFRNKRYLLKDFVVLSIVGILAGIVTWLPVLAGTGIGALVNAATLDGPIPAHHTMWWHIRFISLWLTGWSWGWALVGISAALLIGLATKKWRLVGLSGALFFLSIVIVPVMTGSYLFPRVWVFLLSPLGWAIIALLAPVLRSMKNVTAIVLFFLLVNTYAYTVYVERTWSAAWNHTSAEVGRLFLKNDVQSYYTDFDYILPIVEYYYRVEEKSIRAHISNKSSLQYGDMDKTKAVDAIVDAEGNDLVVPPGFILAYSDTIARVYLKR